GSGNGGKVVLWSNQQTTFAGTILAQGGALGGDGGFVETSSHGAVNFVGAQVNTTALNGATGTWLVDPTDLTIDATAATTISNDLKTANVTIVTSASGASGPGTKSSGAGDIDVQSSINWSAGTTLTLHAYHDININASITAAKGGLILNAGSTINPIAAVNVATFTLQNGIWTQVSSSLPSFSANDFRLQGGTFLRALGGDGSSGKPYQIADVFGLQGIGSASLLGQNFVLAKAIDASGTKNWNGGAGFVPIGTENNPFTGVFDGGGKVVDGLTVNTTGVLSGLFGQNDGTIRNLGLTNVSISNFWSGQDDNAYVGALSGINNGSIINTFATGTVASNSTSSLAPDTGGLVGMNAGSISQSHADVSVTDTSTGIGTFLGGLVGFNLGVIEQSYAAGPVTNASNSPGADVGGLVGANELTITGSYASGPVNGGAAAGTGGLAGLNDQGASITQSYAVGTVSGKGDVGGLIGTNAGTVTPFEPPQSNTPSVLPPVQVQIIQDLIQTLTLVSLAPNDVVNTQLLNQPPSTNGGSRPGSGPGQGPGGLSPEFGSRFFVVPPVGETHFVKDEVVLQIPSNIPLSQLQPIFNRLGLTVLGSQNLSLLGVTSYRLHIGSGQSVAAVIRAAAIYQLIAGAQAEYTFDLVQQQSTPSDVAQPQPAPTQTQMQSQQPDLASLTQSEGDAAQYAISKLGLIDIHRQFKGGNISVAVIDSQIDVQHPDLDGVVAEQFDAVGEADKPHPHGTGMAGAIFAHRKLMGVAPSARLYAVHAFSSSSANAESTTFNILRGLEWASEKDVRVINMSFAGPRDPSLERLLRAAHDKGIVLIAAAGNAGPKSPPLYPGADPNVIAVTATDEDDKLFPGANRGKYIAVAAPGVDILVPAPQNSYQLTTGTSVASAEVSGLAALVLERNPNLSPEDVRKILTSSARHLGNANDFGSGLVDPNKAIEIAGDFSASNITGSTPQQRPDDPRRARSH
ncbi:MAG TPA: S8 family serine peptidase, partial [Bradyrhizobium sp.]|nr:S8 family serine peptidase [Bradyrhizobium sp.]